MISSLSGTLRSRLFIACLLALLMACTRGHHVSFLAHLPSASTAVFFLGGVLLGQVRYFIAFFFFALSLDVGHFLYSGSGAECLTPSYVSMIPAYGALWWGGHLWTRYLANGIAPAVTLVIMAVLAAIPSTLLSGGGYYWFSGYFDAPTLSVFAERWQRSYQRALSSMLSWVVPAALVYFLAEKLAEVAAPRLLRR
ncbi:hypothetical protein Q4485_12425 [Granulosicoccaceae sp. 1_MG-2023]|nr:hypothetical protein [Granulosicoccaceae sp. 1_MG-2023]